MKRKNSTEQSWKPVKPSPNFEPSGRELLQKGKKKDVEKTAQSDEKKKSPRGRGFLK